MIIRLSQQLARKFKLTELATAPLLDDPLRDWSMQMFVFDRKQYVIICNTVTLYSAVFLAAKLIKPHALVVTGLQAIGEQLEADHLLDAYQQRCTSGSSVVTYAKSLNRSVTGSMNEQIIRATNALADEENLFVTSSDVNLNLLSILKDEHGRKYSRPGDVMTLLLESPPRDQS